MNNCKTKLSTVAALVIAAITQPIMANESQQDTEKDVEVITVTGSHLKGVDLEGAQPLISISSEDIRDSGASTISELMKNIGATRGGTIRRFCIQDSRQHGPAAPRPDCLHAHLLGDLRAQYELPTRPPGAQAEIC